MRSASHASLFALVIILTSGLGFIREIIIARTFGASLEMDCFIVAFAIVSFIGAILSPQTVQTMFMPSYQDTLKHSPERAGILINNISKLLMTILVAGTLLGYLLAPYIVKVLMPGFTLEQIHLTKHLIRIMMPLVILYGMASVGHALCNSHKRFVLPLSSQTMNNITLLGLLLFVPIQSVSTLAWYHLFGGIVAGLILLIAYFRLVPNRRTDSSDHTYIKALKASWPLLILALLDQAAQLLPRSFGSLLEHGDITALNYGFRLITLPVAIIAMAIASVLFPTIIDHVRNKSTEDSEAIRLGTAMLLFSLSPIAILMCVENHAIVHLFFSSKSFDAEAVGKTASALRYYAIGIVGFGYLLLLNRIYCAHHRYWPYVHANLAAFAILIISALLLISPMGHNGIALAFTLYCYTACMILLIGMRRFSTLHFPAWGSMIRIVLSLAVASLVLWQCKADNLFMLAAESCLFIATYAASLWLMRDPLLRAILKQLGITRSHSPAN